MHINSSNDTVLIAFMKYEIEWFVMSLWIVVEKWNIHVSIFFSILWPSFILFIGDIHYIVVIEFFLSMTFGNGEQFLFFYDDYFRETVYLNHIDMKLKAFKLKESSHRFRGISAKFWTKSKENSGKL